MLETLFALRAHGTNSRTELLAGLTTFLTMAYIAFINPSILADAGMPKGAVFVATCLVAALGSAIMGLYANYPVACAPGMGLNAYFAYVVVLGMGYRWETALGAVFISGVSFLLITLLRLRRVIVDAIPQTLRVSLTVGVGLFLALIALRGAGIVVGNKATLVALGDLRQPSAVLAVIGFVAISAMSQRRVPGALLIGILSTTVLSFAFAGNRFAGILSAPPSLAPTLFALDIRSALHGGILNIVLIFFLVELFDATGTLMGIAGRAGLSPERYPERFNRALMADSSAIFIGSLLGTSSTTAYLESAAGIEAGGRTGLTALTVAMLFLGCLFFSPLAGSVPAYATAPALFYVSCLMLREMAALNWVDPSESMPACVTALLIPLTYSIATGIGCGFISFVAIKLLSGRGAEVRPVTWLLAAVFLFRFIYIAGG